MANVKFTKDMIKVNTQNITTYANEILAALKETDTFESLDAVERYTQRIEDCIENIKFRLNDCDEY